MARVWTTTVLLMLVAIAIPNAIAQLPVSSSPLKQADAHWFRFRDCSEKKALRLEVLVNGNVVHRSSFPICHELRTTENRQKIVAFYFKGGQVYQNRYHTLPTQTVEGNMWQAGSESDALLLGVSFSTKNQVLLNTIHMRNQTASLLPQWTAAL